MGHCSYSVDCFTGVSSAINGFDLTNIHVADYIIVDGYILSYQMSAIKYKKIWIILLLKEWLNITFSSLRQMIQRNLIFFNAQYKIHMLLIPHSPLFALARCWSINRWGTKEYSNANLTSPNKKMIFQFHFFRLTSLQ